MEVTTTIDAQLPGIVALLESNGLVTEDLLRHRDTLYVISQGGGIRACAGLELYGATALLRGVAVAAAWRGQGLGRAVTAHAIRECRQNGVRSVYLLTETAESFFRGMGFSTIPRERVPLEVVSNSAEFRGACPDTAVAMCLDL